MNVSSSRDSVLAQVATALIQQLISHASSTPANTTTQDSMSGAGQSASSQAYSAQPPTATGSELGSSQEDTRNQELVAVITEIAQLVLHTAPPSQSQSSGVSGVSGAATGASGGTTGQGSTPNDGSGAVTGGAGAANGAVSGATGATGQVGTGSPMIAGPSASVPAGLANADTSMQPVPGTGPAVVAKPTQATYGGWQDLATKQTRSSYQTNTYPGLAQNKASVLSAIKASGATPQESALVMACAMKETATMSAKDAESPNLFNMNIGMLHDLGYQGDGSDLGDPSKAVPWMVKAIRTFGPEGFLAYHRAGPTGYQDGHSFDVAGYTADASRISNILMANPQLMTNDQRVE